MQVASALDPIRIPDWAWQQPETRVLLCHRDVAALLKFAQRYGGASQQRLAAATGMSQGRVNEIIHGRRDVSRFEVFLRIAAGLNMPDSARAAFGLAPAQAGEGQPTGSGEIGRVFANTAMASEEIRRRAAAAAQLDVLAVRGLGIIGLNDSMLRPALMAREERLRARILLLDPDSDAGRRRADEIHESHQTFTAGIQLAIARLSELTDHVDMAVYLYDRLPVWRIVRLDEVMYVSTFTADWEGHESTVYEIPHTPRGAFWAGYERAFEDTLAHARQVI